MTDEDSYRKLFVAESLENHETIVNNILVLEEGSDDTAIDEIFRAAHTLKGMSASMGYMQMEHLCHKMEDVFHCIRSGELDISPELTDILLACTDRIEEMIEDIESGGDSSTIEAEDLVEKLKDYETGGNGIAPAPGMEKDLFVPEIEEVPGEMDEQAPYVPGREEVPGEPSFSGAPVIPRIQRYKLKITIAKDCNMKDVRALIVLQNLEELGQIISSNPSAEDIDEGLIGEELEILIESDSGDEALKSAALITDVKNVEVLPVGEDISEKIPEYKLNITIEPECGMKDVRAMIVLQNLEKIGNIIMTSPTVEEIDSGEIKDTFEVIISSNTPESEILQRASGTEIREVKIELFGEEISPGKDNLAGEQPLEIDKGEVTETADENVSTGKTDELPAEKKPSSAAISEDEEEDEAKPRERGRDNGKKREVKNLRVDISRLDQMMNLVEDLVINGGRLKQISKEYQIKEMDEALNMVSR